MDSNQTRTLHTGQVRGRYGDGATCQGVEVAYTGEHLDAFDAWLARVRRDAQREAWTDCVNEASARGWLHAPAVLNMLDCNPYGEAGR